MTNVDYSIAYTALRTQAKAHGVNPNTFEMAAFLKHVAEVMSQSHADARNAMRYLHTLEHRLGSNINVEV